VKNSIRWQKPNSMRRIVVTETLQVHSGLELSAVRVSRWTLDGS
jgi:hypothetical protein